MEVCNPYLISILVQVPPEKSLVDFQQVFKVLKLRVQVIAVDLKKNLWHYWLIHRFCLFLKPKSIGKVLYFHHSHQFGSSIDGSRRLMVQEEGLRMEVEGLLMKVVVVGSKSEGVEGLKLEVVEGLKSEVEAKRGSFLQNTHCYLN